MLGSLYNTREFIKELYKNYHTFSRLNKKLIIIFFFFFFFYSILAGDGKQFHSRAHVHVLRTCGTRTKYIQISLVEEISDDTATHSVHHCIDTWHQWYQKRLRFSIMDAIRARHLHGLIYRAFRKLLCQSLHC